MARPQPQISEVLQSALQKTFALAKDANHEFITLEHLLLALQDDPLVSRAEKACGGDVSALKKDLKGYLDTMLETLPDGESLDPSPTLGFSRVLERAILHTVSSGAPQVDGGAVLAALLQEKESHAAFFLQKQGVTRLPLLKYLSHGASSHHEFRDSSSSEPLPRREEENEEGPVRDPLKAYAVDLIRKAEEGRIDPLIGREEQVERMIHVLCRRRKNNPLLVGETGVGKTAIAEGLALRIRDGKVPDNLKNAPYFALDMGSMLAGTRYRGDFEQRVKAVIEALEKLPGALLFIDEIHTLVGAGAVSGGTMDASNLLKPVLASGGLRCVGATTYQDVKASFDRDRPLARRFQKIDVVEPTEEDTISILKGLRSNYENHHGVRFSEEAIEGAVRLSSRHLRDALLPDKAIDVLDEAGAAQKVLPARKRKKVIGLPEIENVIAQMARVPIRTVSSDDKTKLANLESELKTVIYGQDPAIDQVSTSIKLSRSGLRGHERPVGSFLFAGPTGVGKTELAKQLARITGVQFLRFDMSEYMEKHAVSRLIGSPPGYVGFDEGGLLVDAVRKNPHAVLLLDEIEKAHPDLFSILLQVMDHATLTDNHGRRADFRHVILILTTNAGAREVSARKMGFGVVKPQVSSRGAIEKAFSPEFRNRLDAIIHFAALGPEEILKVVDKNLVELRGLLKEKNVELEVSQEAREWLAEKGYDSLFGARPMARLMEERLKKPLADAILFGALQKGGKAIASRDQDGLSLTYKD